MAAKHTPGPWEACEPGDYSDYGGDSIVVLGNDMRITVVQGSRQEDLANARLIAAAPELLAAAKNFDAYEKAVEAGDDIDAMCIYAATSRMMRAAIAKATGEQQ